MAKFRLKPHELKDFKNLIRDTATHKSAQEMKNYIQHADVSTYRHAMAVALLCFFIVKRFKIKTNEKSLVKGAFLHDYFLYDWHNKGDRLHGYHHPAIAAENAKRDFNVTDHEASIIKTHMWPLTITKIPKSREAAIVCIADKMISSRESFAGNGKIIGNRLKRKILPPNKRHGIKDK